MAKAYDHNPNDEALEDGLEQDTGTDELETLDHLEEAPESDDL